MIGILCNTIEEFNALNDKVKVYGDANNMDFEKWACPITNKNPNADQWMFLVMPRIEPALTQAEMDSVVTLDEDWEIVPEL
jgi:hypothetical protein